MRVEKFEYGGDPEADYPEHWDSFKIYEVWSEPVVEDHEDLPANTTIYESPSESPLDPKRLVVAVEFSLRQGSYFYIETPRPAPEWIKKVFELLREEGWQGHSFECIRNNCRGEIFVINRKTYTAVIDMKEEMALHNYKKSKGGGVTEELESFNPETL